MNNNLEEYKRKNLRACQLKQLSILKQIDAICKKHDIPYWLDGGTLLGAIRHDGFIPWDDDIDIAMMLDDYKRFLDIAPKELPEGLVLQIPDNETTKEPIAKVRDLNSFFVEPGDDMSLNYQKGVFVDIFPFVKYPNVSKGFVKKVTKGISISYSILCKKHYYSLRSAVEWPYFTMKLMLCKFLWKCANLFCKKDHLGNLPINNGYGKMHVYDEVFPLTTVTFEGEQFPSPRDPHAYCEDLFTNHMQMPAEKDRKIHAIFIQPELIKE